MAESCSHPDGARDPGNVHPEVVEQVKRYYESRDHLRRGLCLLNAGCHRDAATAFTAAVRLNPDSATLEECLVRAHVGCGDYASAAEHAAALVRGDPDDVTARVRHAMLIWKKGDTKGAVASLRDSIAAEPDCAELHFQLGNMLAEMGQSEEAEMRFTLTIQLDPRHVDAMVNLAMCHAAGEKPTRALRLLHKAQGLRPRDARIGLLLGMALQAGNGSGQPVNGSVTLPADTEDDQEHAAEMLSRIVQGDPGFLDAFTGVSADQELCGLLAETLRRAVERCPDAADLHYHRGWVLDRLGDVEQAVASTEKTLTVDPRHIRGLIQLAQLYRKTGRVAEAMDRLEETLRLGACYADVYVLLGSLYRERGQDGRARQAYRLALEINQNYEEARAALEALPA